MPRAKTTKKTGNGTTKKTTKKTTTRRKTATKKAAGNGSQPAVAEASSKAPAKKKAHTRKARAKAESKSIVHEPVVSPDERQRWIAETAYMRAAARGFDSDPVADWLEAESEIDSRVQVQP